EFSSRIPTARIVLLADDSDGRKTLEALHSGVRAIIPRNSMAGQIVGAIQAAAAGLVVIHPVAVEAVLSTAPSIEHSAFTEHDQALTPREIEVLSLIAEGLGNK